MALSHRRKVKNNPEKKKIINLCDTYRVQVESWCGGGLIHIHPLPSVLLGGVSWPLRGSAR